MAIIAVIVLVVVVVVGAAVVAERRFDQMVDEEVRALLGQAQTAPEGTFTYADLEGKPPLLQAYLKRSLPDGTPIIRTAHLAQNGVMRNSPDGGWLPLTAEQTFSAQPLGFIWHAKANIAPLVSLNVRDKYISGDGHMLIKASSLIPIGDVGGEELSRSALIRLMGEMFWMPTVMLSEQVTWETVDDATLRATVRDGGHEVSATFHFNEAGDVTAFVADNRPRDGHGNQRFIGEVTAYETFDGVRVPSQIQAVWHPVGEDRFHWLTLDVTDYERDVFAP